MVLCKIEFDTQGLDHFSCSFSTFVVTAGMPCFSFTVSFCFSAVQISTSHFCTSRIQFLLKGTAHKELYGFVNYILYFYLINAIFLHSRLIHSQHRSLLQKLNFVVHNRTKLTAFVSTLASSSNLLMVRYINLNVIFRSLHVDK